MAGRHANDPDPAAETVLVQVRIPRDLMRQIDHYRIDHDLFRAKATELILEAGLARIAERGDS